MPIQTKAPTTSTTKLSTPQLEIFTISKNRNENNGPTSTFDDLLNSFQKDTVTSTSPSTTTTRRPQLTTFSDADDIAFLQGLVWNLFILAIWLILHLTSCDSRHMLLFLFTIFMLFCSLRQYHITD